MQKSLNGVPLDNSRFFVIKTEPIRRIRTHVFAKDQTVPKHFRNLVLWRHRYKVGLYSTLETDTVIDCRVRSNNSDPGGNT